MGRERRGEPRYVVEGLRAAVDGVECVILDIALSSVRLFRQEGGAAAPEVELRLWGEPGFAELDVRCRAILVRSARYELVYRFEVATPAWPASLPLFDTFKDFHVAGLEG